MFIDVKLTKCVVYGGGDHSESFAVVEPTVRIETDTSENFNMQRLKSFKRELERFIRDGLSTCEEVEK